jgi:hypothetical protein
MQQAIKKRKSKQEELEEQVACQMIKRGHNGILDPDRKQSYLTKYKEQITWAIKNCPRSSVALPAVIAKSLVKHQDKKEKIHEFCQSLVNATFNGAKDPVHLLWQYLQKHKGRNTLVLYRKTTCAILAYLNEEKIDKLTEEIKDV